MFLFRITKKEAEIKSPILFPFRMIQRPLLCIFAGGAVFRAMAPPPSPRPRNSSRRRSLRRIMGGVGQTSSFCTRKTFHSSCWRSVSVDMHPPPPQYWRGSRGRQRLPLLLSRGGARGAGWGGRWLICVRRRMALGGGNGWVVGRCGSRVGVRADNASCDALCRGRCRFGGLELKRV